MALDPHVHVVTDFANARASELVSRVMDCLKHEIGELRGDPKLQTVWDEICVQVQGEESLFWNAYVQHLEQHFERQIEELETYELRALWLQTLDGEMWWSETETSGPVPYERGAIVDWLVGSLLSEAADEALG